MTAQEHHPVGAGLRPANGAAGASEKNASANGYRQPRQRCALVRPAEPISYNSRPNLVDK